MKPFKQSSPYESLYASWFRNSVKLIEFDNPALLEETGSLLIISDSYDDSLDRFFSANYRHVYELDPRYFTDASEIEDFIHQHPDIRDAIFVLSLDAYNQMESLGIINSLE